MLPTSLAIAWPLWRRHRWGLLAMLSFLASAVVVATVTTAVFDAQTVTAILGPISMPLLFPAGYLVAIFSFGFDADVNARESCFPAGLFRLPVRTGALVGWPMAYGAAAMLLLWFVIAWFILRPWLDLWNLSVPLWWPAALAVATLAWFQAVLWVPVGLPVLRIVLSAILVPGLIAAAEVGVNAGLSQSLLVGVFAGSAGLAWMVAYVGVRYARRGDMPSWEIAFRPLRQLGAHPRARRQPRRRQPFAGAAQAQMWFEWRRMGLSLPILIGVLLPFVLLPLLFGKNDAIPTARTLLGALAVPVFLAGLAGTTVSGNHPWVKDYYGVAPFTATLPMTSADLVRAKLKAAALSTLAAWAVLAVMVSSAVVLTGNLEEVTAWWQEGLREHGPLKIVAGIMAAATLLIVWTWKRMVDSLFLGLTGRKWIIQSSIYGNMAGLVGLGIVGAWLYKSPESHDVVLAVFPWLLGIWVFCRVLAAGCALRCMLRQDLIKAGTAVHWLLAWSLLGLALFGALAWIVPGEVVPIYYVAFGVLLVLPMAHMAATPLALAWNRHR